MKISDVDAPLKSLLESAKRIAVLGAKDTPGHPVDRVGRYLLAVGYEVVPVHPKRRTVWGLDVFPSLPEVPGRVDIVDVFRASEYCPAHAREAACLVPLPGIFWMQLGIENAVAASLLAGKGVLVVENACLMMEHLRLFG